MAGRMSKQIRFRPRALSLNKNTQCSSDVFTKDLFLNCLLDAFELEKSDFLLLFGDAIGETRSRRSCAFGIFENVKTIVATLLNEFDGLPKIFFSLTWEPDDDIARQRQPSR